jgi:hypothetical protein
MFVLYVVVVVVVDDDVVGGVVLVVIAVAFGLKQVLSLLNECSDSRR